MANKSSINLWTLSVNNIRSEDISAIAIPNVNGAVTPEKLDRAYAQLSGDTFTGSVTVSKNNKSITFDGEKIYRQDGSASSRSYLFPSTPGTLATTQQVNASLQNYLQLSGGNLSGNLYKVSHVKSQIENPLYERYAYINGSGYYYCSDKNGYGLIGQLGNILFNGDTNFDQVGIHEIFPKGEVPLTAQNPLSDIIIGGPLEGNFTGGTWRNSGENIDSIEYTWYLPIGSFYVYISVFGEPNEGFDHISAIWGDRALYNAWQLYKNYGEQASYDLENGQEATIAVYCDFHFADISGNNGITATTFEEAYDAEMRCFQENQYLVNEERDEISRFALMTDIDVVSADMQRTSALAQDAYNTANSEPKFTNWKNNYGSISATSKTINIGENNVFDGINFPVAGRVNNLITIGKETSAVIDNYYSINPNAIAIGYNSIAKNQGIAIGSKVSSDSGVAIGEMAKAAYRSISIGENARSCDGSTIAIGMNSIALSSDGIAIGVNASSNNKYAIQLGTGTNTEVSSFQVYDWKLLDHNGNVPEERLSHLNFMTKDALDGLFVHLSGDEVLSDRLYLTGSELASKDVKNPYYKKYVFCSSAQLSDPVDVYDVDPWTQFLAMSADSSTTTTIVRNVGPNLSGMELSDIANSYIELTASEVPCEYTHDDYGEQGYLNFHWRWNWKYLDGEIGLGTLIIDAHLDSSGRTGSDSISSLSQQELLRKTIGVMFGGESGVQENGEVLIANFGSDNNMFLLNYEGLDTTGTQEEILNEYLTKLPMFTANERILGTYQYVKQHERDPFLVSSDVSAFTGELVTGLRDSIERDLESLKNFDYDAPGGEILATLIHNVGVLTTTIKNVSNLLNRYS